MAFELSYLSMWTLRSFFGVYNRQQLNTNWCFLIMDIFLKIEHAILQPTCHTIPEQVYSCTINQSINQLSQCKLVVMAKSCV